jgi:hypothetical protein
MARKPATQVEPEPQPVDESGNLILPPNDDAPRGPEVTPTPEPAPKSKYVAFKSVNPRQIVAVPGGYARFEGGTFVTNDPSVIARLDDCEVVERS